MNITYLIGNGFDLNLGFKTSYQNFYDYYLSLPYDPSLARFKKIISNQRYSTWSDAELGLGEITKEFKDENSIKEFDTCYDNIVEKLSKYLKEEQDKFIFIAQKSDIAQTTYNVLSSVLSTSFIHKDQFEMISSLYDGNQSINYNFINFNYTNIFDNFISTLISEHDSVFRSLKKTNVHINTPIHIHGSLDDTIIFGVDNNEQISNEVFKNNKSFTDFAIKKNGIDVCDVSRNSTTQYLLNNSDIICTYGISFGETDRNWWELIKNWLERHYIHQLVVFTYDELFKPSSPRSLANIKNTVTNKLFSSDYLNYPKHKQVHFSVNSSYFDDFKQLISNVTKPANII